MSDAIWYYEKHGQQHGPVTEAVLKQLVASGAIDRANLVWKAGERDWTASGTHEILIPSFTTPPPPPPDAPSPSSVSSVRSDAPSSDAVAEPSASSTPLAASTKTVDPAWLERTEPLRPSELLPEAPSPGAEVSISIGDPQRPEQGSHQQDRLGPDGRNTDNQEDDVPERDKPGQQDPPRDRDRETRREGLPEWVKGFLGLVVQSIGQSNAPSRLVVTISLALLVPTSVISYVVFVPRETPPLKELPAPLVAVTQLHGTRVPVGYAGPVGQLTIDANPWAELTRLVDANGTVLDVPGLAATPLVLLVPPGTYRIELDREEACTVTVAHEQSRACSHTMRIIDAATYYQEIGW
ncbi:MAG: DUF4339 domain-containing protein [Acidobacteriota bacterium]